MAQRGISEEDIAQVLANGETIEDYPNDTPYPSRLILGWRGLRPIHVVAATNTLDNKTIVITVYEPDPKKWAPDFKRRKP
jgi:hypothetical protein